MRTQNLVVNFATQRGVDAVADLGIDPTGTTDCSQILQSYLNLQTRNEIHFPIGRYYFKSPVITSAGWVKIIGDGPISNMTEGSVVFCTDQPMQQLLWFQTNQSASQMQSVWIDHIQFVDSSPGHNVLSSAVRITNQANLHFSDVGGMNLIPQRYSAGTVNVTAGSKTVTGVGTSWWSGMVPGFIIINGYPYEITGVQSATLLTIGIAYQGATATSQSYAMNLGGILLWFEPGMGFTQYGQIDNLKSHTVGTVVYCSAGTGGTGTSRIKFNGGYVNGASLPDCIGAYFGPFSDTMKWNVAMNSWAFGVLIAGGHQNDISSADFENAGSIPVVTGGTPRAVLVMGDNASNCYGNRIINNYARRIDIGFELYGLNTQTIIAFNTTRSNTTDYKIDTARTTNLRGEMNGVFYGTLASHL